MDIAKQLAQYKKHFNGNADYPFAKKPNAYEFIRKIGQGSGGMVFKAKCRTTDNCVAMKLLGNKTGDLGFPPHWLREIRLHQRCNHENIVKLIEVFSRQGEEPAPFTQYFLVLEHCSLDLSRLAANRELPFGIGHIKTIAKSILTGVSFLHRERIIHRDLKHNNVLVTNDGILKIADLGHAVLVPNKTMFLSQPNVGTSVFRAPEQLCTPLQYNSKIDIWSTGCIIGALFLRKLVFQGLSDSEVLKDIQNVCGIKTEIDSEQRDSTKWLEAGVSVKVFSCVLKREDILVQRKLFREQVNIKNLDEIGIEFMNSMLNLDHKIRFTASMALGSLWFMSYPYPEDNIKDILDYIERYQLGKSG